MRWLLLLVMGVCSCQTERGPAPPEGVVQEFLQLMYRVQGDTADGRRVLELLSHEAKENLAERARRASAASGHSVDPADMLVPALFSLKFEPQRFVSTVQGRWAVVSVYGPSPKTQIEEVRCVEEGGQWRVALELPALRPIEKREGADKPAPR